MEKSIDQSAFSKDVSTADNDHDGFVSFYVTNQGGINFLFHNKANLIFTEVAGLAGVQAPGQSNELGSDRIIGAFALRVGL